MKQRTLALLLAAATVLSLLGAAALAAEDGGVSTVFQEIPSVPDAGEAQTRPAVPAPEEEPSAQPETPEGASTAQPETSEEYIPDSVGTVSFANLSRRMREKNLQVLSIQASIDSVEAIDYEYIKEDLRDQINQLAPMQWMLVMMGQQGTLAYEKMDQANKAVWDQYQSIKDGEMQADNADVVRQLKNLQDQIVMAGEATYIALAAMEIQEDGLERQFAALDRTLEELELRYKLGHISSMTLKEAQAGETALDSGLSTLRMNLNTYKGQLEMMIGADITGEIALGPLPSVSQKDLDAMDLEKDLDAAKENSWSLYSAALDLADAKEAFQDWGGENAYDARKKQPQYIQVRGNYHAAQHTYNNTVQSFELGLRNLYLKVKDCKQILDASRTALSVAQSNTAAAQLKYSQGALSKNGLLEVEDKEKEAREKVNSAANDLFSAYNTYRWAVDYGIMN